MGGAILIVAEQARYDLFAYLDHDDLYFPRCLESLLPLFDEYDLVFAPYEILENARLTLWNIGALWQQRSYICGSEGQREPPFGTWVRAGLQQINLSVPLGVANRREIFELVGGFQPGIVRGEDGILWRRMADRGVRIGFSPVVAGRYYAWPDGQARTRQSYSTGAVEIQKDHPLGANGQYLDAEWFAALKRDPQGRSGS